MIATSYIATCSNIVDVLGILLGYNLTDVNENIMKNQYDGQYSKNVEELTKYVSFSYIV